MPAGRVKQSKKRSGGERKITRGATTSRQGVVSPARNWLRGVVAFLKLVVLISICAFVLLGAFKSWQGLLSKPIGHVDVQGRFNFVDKALLEEVIADGIDSGFLQLDLDELKALLERLEWIDEVRVSRQWPDTIKVMVIEQRPIARWGTSAVLNQRGQVIELSEPVELGDLPLLSGPEAKSALVMEQYQEVSELLSSYGLALAEVRCDLAENWYLIVSGGVELNLGRHQVIEKLGRFLLVYEQQLKARWIELIKIDLRYDNGVAVEWRV